MTHCDLCDRPKECLQKEIEGKEYDLCTDCWNPLAEKLKGKGRRRQRETVFLPPRRIEQPEHEEQKPKPGEPPKIWASVDKPQ